MSDHDFEKQVNQKLEELKLRPSDTVWMEVERNIRQHKRRRRFLWLWSAALLITLTTSGVVLYHYTSDTRKTTEMAQTKPAALSNEPTTVSPNSTNKQATTVQSVPENASSNPDNETVQSIQPTENNQPGTIPPAAPVINLPIDKQPAGTAPVTAST
jgi:cytoskeletal protein RodZ